MEKKRILLLMSLFTFLTLFFLWFQVNRSYTYVTPQEPSISRSFSKLGSPSHHNTHPHPPNSSVNTHQSRPSKPPKSNTETVPYIRKSKHFWRTIDNSKNVQLKLFSAYFDDRDSPQVYVLGYENHDAEHKYYCALAYDDMTLCSLEPATRVNVNDDVDPFKDYNIALWGFYFICKLPSAEIPTEATISLKPDCTLNSESDWLPVLNREKKEVSEMRKFGVCVQGPVYDMNNPQVAVEFLEIHRALGAELVTIYIQNAGPLVWKVLQQYVDEGLVDLINWNLTFVEGAGYVHYRGQSLLVNECIYRNMYRVQYLAMNDLDEVIVPGSNFGSWSDMLSSLEAPGRGAFLFGHTTFTGEKESVKEDLLVCRDGKHLKAIEPPRYLTRHKRSMQHGYEKFIIKPLCSRKASFHRIFGFTSGYSLYKVPASLGLSYHYRDPPLPSKSRAVYDDRLRTLFPDVIEKIRERLCSLYNDV